MSHRDALKGQIVWTRATCERVTIHTVGQAVIYVTDRAGALFAVDAFDIAATRAEAAEPLLRAGRELHFTAVQP